jgi:hypothetical protein
MKRGNSVQAARIQLPHVLTATHKRSGERKSTAVHQAHRKERKYSLSGTYSSKNTKAKHIKSML